MGSIWEGTFKKEGKNECDVLEVQKIFFVVERSPFTHDGFSVVIRRHGNGVIGDFCDQCIKIKFAEWFKPYGEKLVSKDGKGRIKINWDYYAKRKGHSDEEVGKMINLLLLLGVLSCEPNGNWDVVAAGPIGLGPRVPGVYFYFTQGDTAMEFALSEYADPHYYWEVRHIGTTLSKQDVLSGRLK